MVARRRADQYANEGTERAPTLAKEWTARADALRELATGAR